MSAPAFQFRLQDVAFSYGADRFALRVNDLGMRAGSSLLCKGPSGSGKTTLLELIAGLIAPQSGRVEFLGTDWSPLSQAARQRQRLAQMGLVFQGFELIASLTLQENILLPLRFLGRHARADLDRAQELMEQVGIEELAHCKPDRLSFGERQRAAICRALIAQPSVVLADEPTANLDDESTEKALTLLLDYVKAHNATLFLVSHDVRQTSRVDRVLHMQTLASEACV